MIEDGLFERFPCDSVFGMHNRPGLPLGKFAVRSGADDGRRRLLRHRHHRQGRARRAARVERRPGAGRVAPHRGAADHRLAQRAAGRDRGGLGDQDPRRRRLQRDSADRALVGHGARLLARGDGAGRALA